MDLTEQLDAERHRAQQLENELRRIEQPSNISVQQAEKQAVAQWAERCENLEKQLAACQDTVARLQCKIVGVVRFLEMSFSGTRHLGDDAIWAEMSLGRSK